MRVAVIGSRKLTVEDLQPFLPKLTSEIISGGAKGIDSCARAYALQHKIPFTAFLPEYSRYGRAAPMVRNRQMVDAADAIVALWDGISHGTAYTIAYAQKRKKPLYIFLLC